MADIKITPEELKGQASQMTSLKSQYESLFHSVTSELRGMNQNWSSLLANNFMGKINSAGKGFLVIESILRMGATAALQSARTMESVDSALAKMFGGDAVLHKGGGKSIRAHGGGGKSFAVGKATKKNKKKIKKKGVAELVSAVIAGGSAVIKVAQKVISRVVNQGVSPIGTAGAQDNKPDNAATEKNTITTKAKSYTEDTANHVIIPRYNENQVGTVISSVTDESDNIRYPYNQYQTFGGEADRVQCVAYAKGRFQELTGVPPQIRCSITGYAIDWQTTYQQDGRFEYVTDINTVKVPAIAVTHGDRVDWGHVLIVEDIYTSADGTKYIYYSDGNHSGQRDGTLYKVPYSEFCTGGTNPYGFVQLK